MENSQEAILLHFERLRSMIQNSIEITHQNQFKKYIEGLSFYLKKLNLNLEIQIVINSKPCDQCGEHIKEKNQDKVIKLNCNHISCKPSCLQNLVKNSNKNLALYLNTKCKLCNIYISEDIILNAFGGEEAFKKILNDFEEERPAKFVCGLCFLKYRVDESITLECDHRYDKECLSIHVKIAIDEGRVTEADISCPECAMPIDIPIIKYLIDLRTYEKFERFRNRAFAPKDEENIVFYRCNGNDCEYFEFLDEKIWFIKCPCCGIEKCPKCRDDPHKGLTCNADFKLKEDIKRNNEFLQAAASLGYKKCPHCNVICEKIDGCNFMKCFSKICRGKNNFCLNCGVGITDSQHFSQHFSHCKAQGPFGEICNTLDGNED